MVTRAPGSPELADEKTCGPTTKTAVPVLPLLSDRAVISYVPRDRFGMSTVHESVPFETGHDPKLCSAPPTAMACISRKAFVSKVGKFLTVIVICVPGGPDEGASNTSGTILKT